MVFTRDQLDTLSTEELVEELIKCSNKSDQLKILTDRFDDFVGKYDNLQSELQFLISQSDCKPRKKCFEQRSVYKKKCWR